MGWAPAPRGGGPPPHPLGAAPLPRVSPGETSRGGSVERARGSCAPAAVLPRGGAGGPSRVPVCGGAGEPRENAGWLPASCLGRARGATGQPGTRRCRAWGRVTCGKRSAGRVRVKRPWRLWRGCSEVAGLEGVPCKISDRIRGDLALPVSIAKAD